MGKAAGMDIVYLMVNSIKLIRVTIENFFSLEEIRGKTFSKSFFKIGCMQN